MDNKTIGNRIKERRKALKLTQSDIKQKFGISTGQLSDIESGNRLPAANTLIQLAEALECSIDYILTGNSPTKDIGRSNNNLSLSDRETLLIERYRSIPKEFQEKIDIYLEISAFNKNTYITQIGYEAVPITSKVKTIYHPDSLHDIPVLGMVAAGKPIEAINNPLGVIQTSSSADYALIISGNSMYPLLHDGDHVLVKVCDSLENGEIGVFYIDNNVTCKKWFKNDKIIKLISINPAYEDYHFDLTDQKNENLNFKIEGKVVFEH